MRLVILLGAAAGRAIEWSEDAVPRKLTLPLGKLDPEIGELTVEYSLFAHDSSEAFYVPSQYNNLQVIKGLLAAQ